MADPVTDPVAKHDARYGEKGAGPPEQARVRDRLVHDDAAGMDPRARLWSPSSNIWNAA